MEAFIPIYNGMEKDFHWAGFGSGKGTNLRECAHVIKPCLIFSDKPTAKLLSLEEFANIPKFTINGYNECGSWEKAHGNKELELEYKKRSIIYNQKIVDLLHKFEDEHGYCIDLIVLGGYMRIVEEPLLKAYPDKNINVHPMDLSLLTEQYQRKYIGEKAVYDALKAGETKTRSSVIIIDLGTDHGEILVQGPELEVWPEFVHGTDAEKNECLEEYELAHQNMQKVRSDWPALTTALKLISQGKIALSKDKVFFNEWRRAYVDEKPLGYGGYQIRGR